MERKALALRAVIKKHCPTKENLDPRKWMREDNVRAFSDFIQNKNLDKDTDKSFDNKEMCEYKRARNILSLTPSFNFQHLPVEVLTIYSINIKVTSGHRPSNELQHGITITKHHHNSSQQGWRICIHTYVTLVNRQQDSTHHTTHTLHIIYTLEDDPPSTYSMIKLWTIRMYGH